MVSVSFYVKTNSPKQNIVYDEDVSAYIISIKSSPTKGKANVEILHFLKKRIRSADIKITIISGKTSNKKLINFTNINHEKLMEKLIKS